MDPAAEVDDPWLAAQLRVGLLDALQRAEADWREKSDQAKAVDEHEARIDRAARVLKQSGVR